MTWEETIKFIRTKPAYGYLVEKAYFEEDLKLNVERYIKSEEFVEILRYIKLYAPNAHSILDIGSGNGITAIALSLNGYKVLAIEPDPSKTIGAGAIRILKEFYKLKNLEIQEFFAEDLKLENEKFDIVFTRQCLHHANDLNRFLKESARVLKKDGLFFSVRDHVVFDEKDKKWFLEAHTLQKYYGGENAYSACIYRQAIEKTGLVIEKELKFYDSVINYFPLSIHDFENKYQHEKEYAINHLKRKIGFLANSKLLQGLYLSFKKINMNDCYDEKRIPGRMYSYIATKK